MVNGEDKPLQGSGDRGPPWSLNHACTGLDPLHRRPEPAEGQTAGTAPVPTPWRSKRPCGHQATRGPT